MTRHLALPILLAFAPLAATAQDKCTTQYDAEQARIVREFAAKAPQKGDRDAEVAWARNLDAALAASAKRAEDCTRASKPAPSPAMVANEKACMEAVSRRADELQKRYGARTMTTQEQIARRGEEDRLVEDRMACMSQRARR